MSGVSFAVLAMVVPASESSSKCSMLGTTQTASRAPLGQRSGGRCVIGTNGARS